MRESAFLSQKYQDLPGSKPVERAVEKSIAGGEKGPKSKEERVDRYIQRLERIAFTPNENGDRRGLELLKKRFLDANTLKYEEIPESYWKNQEAVARSRGQGGDLAQFSEEQKEEARREHAKAVLTDQRASLEQWVDYFGSDDSRAIPSALKYWVLREVIKLKEYDKDKNEFPRRSAGTVGNYPDINYEALAYIVDALQKKLVGTSIEFEHDIQPDERQTFNAALSKEDFAKLYAWANELMHPIPEGLLPITEGEWVTYPQGTDHTPLVESVRGWGTGWCTAGELTAKSQLSTGDFHLYKSLDDEGNPNIPRLAIRMEGDHIAEVRGIANKQNVDKYMGDVLAEKLKTIPGGELYLKRTEDMAMMKVLEEKAKRHEPMTKEELKFLYEIDHKIEYFGQVKDPRIAELRATRNPEQDMLIVFECVSEQIAHSVDQITEQTKAYVGKLEPGIFARLPESVEHIHATFPEGRIRSKQIEIGGKDEQELEALLKRDGHQFGSSALFMIQSDDFKRSLRIEDPKEKDYRKWKLKSPEEVKLIRLTVADLGFPDGATTKQIYQRADLLGLDLCEPEVGPQYRLQYKDQLMDEWDRVGMKQISGQVGNPLVFSVERDADGSFLSSSWAPPEREWNGPYQFVFRPRKPATRDGHRKVTVFRLQNTVVSAKKSALRS